MASVDIDGAESVNESDDDVVVVDSVLAERAPPTTPPTFDVTCVACNVPLEGEGGPHRACVLHCGHHYGRSCADTLYRDGKRSCVLCGKKFGMNDIRNLFLPDLAALAPTRKEQQLGTELREAEELEKEMKERNKVARLQRAKAYSTISYLQSELQRVSHPVALRPLPLVLTVLGDGTQEWGRTAEASLDNLNGHPWTGGAGTRDHIVLCGGMKSCDVLTGDMRPVTSLQGEGPAMGASVHRDCVACAFPTCVSVYDLRVGGKAVEEVDTSLYGGTTCVRWSRSGELSIGTRRGGVVRHTRVTEKTPSGGTHRAVAGLGELWGEVGWCDDEGRVYDAQGVQALPHSSGVASGVVGREAFATFSTSPHRECFNLCIYAVNSTPRAIALESAFPFFTPAAPQLLPVDLDGMEEPPPFPDTPSPPPLAVTGGSTLHWAITDSNPVSGGCVYIGGATNEVGTVRIKRGVVDLQWIDTDAPLLLAVGQRHTILVAPS